MKYKCQCGEVIDSGANHYCRAYPDKLLARIAELEAENAIFRAADYEALRAEKPIYCTKCRDGIVADDDGICGVCAGAQDGVIESLQNKVAELKKSAIVWHKYPDEKPQKTDHCLIHCPILNKRHFDFWHNDIQKWDRYDEYVIHWAYLPEPPDIACDAHIEKSATQSPLPVSGATQAEVDNDR